MIILTVTITVESRPHTDKLLIMGLQSSLNALQTSLDLSLVDLIPALNSKKLRNPLLKLFNPFRHPLLKHLHSRSRNTRINGCRLRGILRITPRLPTTPTGCARDIVSLHPYSTTSICLTVAI